HERHLDRARPRRAARAVEPAGVPHRQPRPDVHRHGRRLRTLHTVSLGGSGGEAPRLKEGSNHPGRSLSPLHRSWRATTPSLLESHDSIALGEPRLHRSWRATTPWTLESYERLRL